MGITTKYGGCTGDCISCNHQSKSATMLSSSVPVGFGVPHDKMLSWAFSAQNPSHHNKGQFLKEQPEPLS